MTFPVRSKNAHKRGAGEGYDRFHEIQHVKWQKREEMNGHDQDYHSFFQQQGNNQLTTKQLTTKQRDKSEYTRKEKESEIPASFATRKENGRRS